MRFIDSQPRIQSAMGPRPDPITSNSELPAKADVVVIGGGIIGTSTALELAERGVSVVLCEKGTIAAEQSSRNWGWVRKMGRDPRELPLIIESLRLWDGLNERVGTETGFRKAGILYTCDNEADVARNAAWLEYARPYQLDTRMLSADETATLLPGMKTRFAGALYTASDGRAEPQKAAPAIARAAQAKGAVVLENCAVRGIERAGGRVSGVVTERGRIACSSVVLAGGAWSNLFCANLDVDLPQLKVMNSVLRTEPLSGLPEVATWSAKYAFRKRLDGGYTVADGDANDVEIVPDSFRYLTKFMPAMRSQWKALRIHLGARFLAEWNTPRSWALDAVTPFERMRTLDPIPNQRATEAALKALIAAHPGFAGAKVAQHWAGMIDVTPDAVPVISPVDAQPGLVVATGFSGHGFGIGPAAGKLAADLVTNARPVVDPTPFRLGRFFDGSKIELVGGI
jgi:glycine/D-amino acid oxidase-like deaminating enzyme